MNRFFTLIGVGILFVILTSFLKLFQSVTIDMNMPEVIEAGTEITVNVTINKGDVSGFARFEHELPVGFTARSQSSANANFSFQNQKVHLVWFRLPDHDEINISYVITANERLMGSIDMGAQFSFIENNDRRSVNTRSRALAINPSPNISPEDRIDVNDYARIASIEAEARGSGSTVAFRQRPVWMEEERFYLVTLLINRDAARNYSKIEETVPAGFTATNLDSKGGIFEFNNRTQVARIIWQNLPLESYFTVTYRLIPAGGVAAPSVNISGIFAFMIDERTFETEVIERNEVLAGLSRNQLDAILRDVNIRSSEHPSSQLADVPPSDTAVPPSSTIVTPPPTQREQPPTTVSQRPVNNDMFTLRPEQGIYYRVQIAAGHRPVNIPTYFRNHRIEQDVMREDHEGWWKYTIGSLRQYSDARDLRVHVSNTSTINDAFVVAYNDGRRITVQDALMALNQRWVR